MSFSCRAYQKNRDKTKGAPIQCRKGNLPKEFHVSHARDGQLSHPYRYPPWSSEGEVIFNENSPTLSEAPSGTLTPNASEYAILRQGTESAVTSDALVMKTP